MRFLVLDFMAALGAIFALGSGAKAEPERERICYSAAETREKIAAHGLSEPFQTMRVAAAKTEAEAIGARLCRRSDDLVYEISLLRHDGRVIRIFVDAKTGSLVGPKNGR